MKETKKIVGIVVEYNPFHNGHKYHLKNAKTIGDIVIGVISGDYVQRGEPSIINRWERARMALKEGVDIVCELPCFYSCQSAELFARGSIGILYFLGVENILFGSESDRLEELKKIVAMTKEKKFQEEIKKQMELGVSYPNAFNKTLKEFFNDRVEINSNDILGIEYLKAIEYYGNNIQAITLKREGGGYYSEIGEDKIISATGIRKAIFEGKKIEKYIPKNSYEILREQIEKNSITNISKFYPLIRYAILAKKETLIDIQDVEIGFEKRLYEMAMKYDNYSEFFTNLLTKRYTMGRTQRILIHILLNITKEDTRYLKENIPYVRIMGFSQLGKKYLKKYLKENKEKLGEIEVLTSFKNIQKKLNEKQLKFLELNERASTIYKIINNYEENKIPIMME